ncbi:hypothetical protein HBI81_184100 [Parastagonospora nodorum]|nr:hypothetical protein HBI80_174960 [Parastagonospora nodorum]KAH5984797.1 hypothetical protein HBI82_221220 [Parastagonospora nodorum]KAH6516879.1 hypothetical protein HBI81_184100 [Parastagonospora nodorum]
MGNSTSTEVCSVAATTPKFDANHWSRLPTELLLQILRHHLTFPNPIKRQTHSALMKMRILPLLLTKNEEFTRYVKSVYYGSNEFLMTPEDILLDRSLPLHIGQHIRHLVFPINSVTGPSTKMPGHQDHWDANWGAYLPNIDSLDVLMTIREAADYWYYMRGHGSIAGMSPGFLTQLSANDYIRALKPKVMALNSKNVSFTVVCQGCPFKFNHPDPVPDGCACASRFEKDIAQRIMGLPEPTLMD